MLFLAILLFALAAMLGFYLLSFVLQDKNTPKGVAFVHGPLALLGLMILIIYAIQYQPAPIVSIIIFVLAALGGLTLIIKDLTGKKVPKWLALTHGFVALMGFFSLIFFAFSS